MTLDPTTPEGRAEPESHPGEEWMPVDGWEGRYFVSNFGRVFSTPSRLAPRILSAPPNSEGYPTVHLNRGKDRVTRSVHTLVAEAFLGKREDGMDVCHADGVRTNNRVENLRWGTRSENIRDSVHAHRTHKESRKTQCIRGHELAHPNLTLHELNRGIRACNACRLARKTKNQNPNLTFDLDALADGYYMSIMGGDPVA